MEAASELSERKVTLCLFNPTHYLAGGKALGLGLALILITAALASTGRVHLDGVLDLHVGNPRVFPFWVFAAEGLLDWLVLGLLLILAGKLLSKSRPRALDILGTQALARWPMLLSVSLGLIPAFQLHALRMIPGMQVDTPAVPGEKLIFLAVLIATMLLIVWMVALMYRAYAVSCNLKGRKAALSFIAALLAAETLSKVVLVKFLLT